MNLRSRATGDDALEKQRFGNCFGGSTSPTHRLRRRRETPPPLKSPSRGTADATETERQVGITIREGTNLAVIRGLVSGRAALILDGLFRFERLTRRPIRFHALTCNYLGPRRGYKKMLWARRYSIQNQLLDFHHLALCCVE